MATFLFYFIYDASYLRVFFCNKLAQFISSYLAYIIYIIQKREKGETDDDTMFIYILLHGNSILYFSNLPLLWVYFSYHFGHFFFILMVYLKILSCDYLIFFRLFLFCVFFLFFFNVFFILSKKCYAQLPDY